MEKPREINTLKFLENIVPNFKDKLWNSNIHNRGKWLKVVSILVAILLLTFIVRINLSFNFEQHQQYQKNISIQKEQDALFNQDVLNSRYRLYNSYDGLNQYLSKIQEKNQQLTIVPKYIEKTGQIELRKALIENTQLIEEKEVLLNRFKSLNAIFKNSLHYLPPAIENVVDNSSSLNSNPKLKVSLDRLLQKILIYNISFDKKVESLIRQKVNKIEQLQKEITIPKDKKQIALILRHAKIILENKSKVDELTEKLVQIPLTQNNQKIEDKYNYYYQKAIERTSIYRLCIYGLSLILLGVIGYLTVDKLSLANRRTIFALKKANITESALEKLNRKVKKTTQEQSNQLLESKKRLRQHNRQHQFLKEFTTHIFSSVGAKSILELAVNEVRKVLDTDIVVVYSFDKTGISQVTAKSVNPNSPANLEKKIPTPPIDLDKINKNQKDWIKVISDVERANLSFDRRNQVKSFGIQSYLVAPIVVGGKLKHLSIAYQYSEKRDWETTEIDLFSWVNAQLGLALDRVNLLLEQEQQSILQREQKFAAEKLQQNAAALSKDIKHISEGNLTVRAKVIKGELGTVARSYNSSIEDLRQIVLQVQTAAKEVTDNTEKNKSSIATLDRKAVQHSEEIAVALDRAQKMVSSIGPVGDIVKQLKVLLGETTQTTKEGDRVFQQTLRNMKAIGETIAKTTNKVKTLGENSHKISQQITMFANLTKQTNLLAIDAFVLASRGGDRAIVAADEISSLAHKSTTATIDLEGSIAEIQEEIHQVVVCLEATRKQTFAKAELLNTGRSCLKRIIQTSDRINELLQEIDRAASDQSQNFQVVCQKITSVASTATSLTSTLTTDLSVSSNKLLAASETLQHSVGQLKAN